MTKPGFVLRRVIAILVLMVFAAGPLVHAQEQTPPAQMLSKDQLDTLVAPIALYPDALLSQVLVAATYPLEIVEAAQWLQRNPDLRGSQLLEAVREQNWDASVQALVVFPEVINRLNSEIRWTTDLGNAFLASQADVMNAVQDMRARARAAGKLDSSPQETVTTETQGDRAVIDIQPADPQVVYVPVYNPEYIWGPPGYSYYPRLYYPEFGFRFGPRIYVSALFGGLGWEGWGWRPNWFECSIYQNHRFFDRVGFHAFRGDQGFRGRSVWAHNPEHRLGVPYPHSALATRFGGANGGAWGRRFEGQRSSSPSLHRLNSGGTLGSRGTGVAVPRFAPQSGGTSGSWSGSGQARRSTVFGLATPRTGPAAPSYGRGSDSYPHSRSNPGYEGTYRSNPSYGGSRSYNGTATTPTYRSTPGYGDGGYRSHPPASYRSNPSHSVRSESNPWYGGSRNYGGTATTPTYRSTPGYGDGGYRSHPTASYRSNPSHSVRSESNPSYGGNRSYVGNATPPTYRATPGYGGSGHQSRPTPSYTGGGPSSSGGSAHGGGGRAEKRR